MKTAKRTRRATEDVQTDRSKRYEWKRQPNVTVRTSKEQRERTHQTKTGHGCKFKERMTGEIKTDRRIKTDTG